jgi:hypothetical protein
MPALQKKIGILGKVLQRPPNHIGLCRCERECHFAFTRRAGRDPALGLRQLRARSFAGLGTDQHARALRGALSQAQLWSTLSCRSPCADTGSEDSNARETDGQRRSALAQLA